MLMALKHVIGDSLIKYVNGYEVLKKLENCKTVVRSFLGSKDEWKIPWSYQWEKKLTM